MRLVSTNQGDANHRITRPIDPYVELIVGALSSIPRWRFARAIGVRECDTYTPRLGNALDTFYTSTCEVVEGRNLLAEHLVNRERESGAIRLTLYAALVRAYLYLADKNDPA